DAAEPEAGALGESMVGFPLVTDTLRGYRGEDAWAQQGHLFRVAGSPVLSRARDRYVGALLIGSLAEAELAAKLRESLRDSAEADIAIFLRGKLLASSVASPALSALPELLGRHAEEMERLRRSAALPLGTGGERFWAMAAPVVGQAALQEAYY